MAEVKNYIYFNEVKKIRKKHIDDLFQGAKNADAIYIFADFDFDGKTCTVMFERADGMRIGEVETMQAASPVLNPATGTEMPCFSYVMDSDVLAVAGSLQISVRLYDLYTDPDTGIADDQIITTAMVTATVYPSVAVEGTQSTVILNLNRKINSLAASLQEHKDAYAVHNHDNRYYQKDESDMKYGSKLAAAGNSIILRNEYNADLSSVVVPTVVQTTPPGALKHSGPGRFILTAGKTYVVLPVLENVFDVKLDVYMAVLTPEVNPEYAIYDLISSPSLEYQQEKFLIRYESISNRPYEDDANYKIDTAYTLNTTPKTRNGLNVIIEGDPTAALTYGDCRLELNSLGYYQVYEL